MRNKPGDIPYLGVRKELVLTAEPTLDEEVLLHLYRFITRRYKVHIKKDIQGLPAPWTKDPVIQNYRFTNVRREHDKETRWLIQNIANNPNVTYEDKLLNCVLFRLYNKHETSELLSQPIPFTHIIEKNGVWDPDSYRALFAAQDCIDPERVFFTGVFMVSGLLRIANQYTPGGKDEEDTRMRPLWLLRHLVDLHLPDRIKRCKTAREVCRVLSRIDGIGVFLGYQMFVDMTYIPEFPFSENEYVVAGRGCQRGCEYLFEDSDDMTYEECIFWLRDHLEDIFAEHTKGKFSCKTLFSDLPPYDQQFNVMSIENCLCELSKYTRVLRKEGRPRKRYQGGQDEKDKK